MGSKLLTLGLLFVPAIAGAQGRRAMPTASLPIEPASDDPELMDTQITETPKVERGPSSVLRVSTGTPNFATQAGLLMSRDGFGAQLRFMEYSAPWLAVTQSLRFQSQEKEDALYEKRYGLMLGVAMHPWQKARLSPVFSLEAGGDRYLRGWAEDELNLFGLEASAGLELKLARAVSFLFQWTEVWYPGLKERLFIDQKPKTAYAGTFQVFFNVRLEGTL